MRIVLLTHEPFFPPTGGGSAEAQYLVEELKRRGHQVHVFAPGTRENAASIQERFGVRCIPFTSWRMGRLTRFRSFKYLAFPMFLKRLVTRNLALTPADLVLAQHAIASVAAGRLKRETGCRCVMNFLDLLTGFMETWPRHLAPRSLVRQLVRFELRMPVRFSADGVLTVSDPLADLFVEHGFSRKRILPIYYGFDGRCFAPDPPREKSGAPVPGAARHPIVVMHGSFDHHHVGLILRDAIRLVAGRRPEVEFRFVGPETRAWKHLERELRKDGAVCRVHCTGFVPYDRVAAELRDAAVGIVPYEASRGTHCAFVAKAVEYLGLGLPTVSTSLDGLRRWFPNEPMLKFVPFDGHAMGNAILDFLANPPAPREAERISRRVHAELDWSVVSRRAAEHVEAIADATAPETVSTS